MRNLILRLLINAAAIYVTVLFVPGIGFGEGGVPVDSLLVVALIFGLVNAIIKPIVKALTCPAYLLTLGLFTFIVNGALLLLTALIARQVGGNFQVDGFFNAVLGGIIISLVSTVLSVFLADE